MSYRSQAAFAAALFAFASVAGAKVVDVVRTDGTADPATIRASEDTVVNYTGPVPATFTGALDADDSTYNRPVTCGALSGVGTAVAFDTVTINNTTGAAANFMVTSSLVGGGACGDANDTFFTVYNGPFNPGAALTNCAAVSDDINGATNRCSSLTFPVPAGGTRIVVVAGFNNADDGGLFPYEISFAGTDVGASGQLAIAPTAVPFGDVTVGSTSAPSTVTLSNTGTASLTVTTLTVPSAPFASPAGTCGLAPITIAAGASCTIDYTFAPTVAGAANETLTVTANAPGSGTIALSGNGVAPGSLTVTPASLAFGDVAVGGVGGPQPVTLANTGGTPLTATITGAVPPFGIGVGTCGSTSPTIAAGASCTVDITFAPTATGAATGTLSVTSSAGGGGSVALSGNGTQGALDFATGTLSFGNVQPGQTGTATQTLTNAGTAPVTINALTTPTPPFTLTGGTCGATPITLAAGASCTLVYTFSPTTPVTTSQTITVTSTVGTFSFVLSGASQSASIPSLGALSLVLLGLLMFGLAFPLLRR